MLIQGDAVRIPLPDKSVHTCVTSPPYWGLRKYSGEQGRGTFPDLGLEKTPQEHIERIVQIMAEVHRVLRDDGVVWLNYGDCYAGSWGNYGSRDGGQRAQNVEQLDRPGVTPSDYRPGTSMVSIPAGNLMLMPHRIAIALQDWGWVVRNDVVWWKRNPMPESQAGWRFERSKKIIGDDPRGNEGEKRNATLGQPPQRDHDGTDFAQPEYEYGEDYQLRKGSWRHTRAHEYVFMLTKKMQYWSNQEAVREGDKVYHRKAGGYTGHERVDGSKPYTGKGGFKDSDITTVGRNPRSVMDVPTQSYKGSHYATFPERLIAPLIRATCPRWACPVCGQGWSPVVEKEFKGRWDGGEGSNADSTKVARQTSDRKQEIGGGSIKAYRPTCEHEHTKDEAVPGIVLDPFVGSGTSVMVAKQLLRRGIGLDISMEYIDQQAKIRTGEGSPSGVLDELPLFALTDKGV